MNFDNLQNMLGKFQKNGRGTQQLRLPDDSEKIIISSLALLKMLKHGRAGVPLEVMGLMLGSFVDEYTTVVVDVFAMPQSGSGVSVEAVDPEFQANMLEMLKQTDRQENVVGWYHSHPGFGPWLSGVDVNTQQSFEQLDKRNVAVVIDPIQSVKGKVVIDCFRLIQNPVGSNETPFNQTTSNVGQQIVPTLQALYNGLNKHYYSMVIDYSKNENDQNMLLNLYKQKWSEQLKMQKVLKKKEEQANSLSQIKDLSEKYIDFIKKQNSMSSSEFKVAQVGKLNPKRHLEDELESIREKSIMNSFQQMIETQVF